MRAHDVGRELAREEQLHARRDRAVDQRLPRVVLGRAAGDAAYQRVLALRRSGEGGWGCEVGGDVEFGVGV